MADRKLVELAAEAMRNADRVPELAVLRALSDEHLKVIIDHHSGPLIVA